MTAGRALRLGQGDLLLLLLLRHHVLLLLPRRRRRTVLELMCQVFVGVAIASGEGCQAFGDGAIVSGNDGPRRSVSRGEVGAVPVVILRIHLSVRMR